MGGIEVRGEHTSSENLARARSSLDVDGLRFRRFPKAPLARDRPPRRRLSLNDLARAGRYSGSMTKTPWLGCLCALGWAAGLLCGGRSLAADRPPKDYAVQLRAQVDNDRAPIVLSWTPDANATGYRISRKTGAGGWQLAGEVGGQANSWADPNVSAGTVYEYQVIKNTWAGYRGTGYIAAGWRVPYPGNRGVVVLVVERGIAGALPNEIGRLEADLRADGWRVARREVWAGDSPQAVREAIRGVYNGEPGQVKAVFLLGHVPVPYSGNIAPDGHDNHRGAWPADTYYGDMDGTWTDQTVNTRAAEREVNWNVPGDEKFDQSVIPSAIELAVGRVDLSNLTCFANKSPSRSEIDLTRQYLNKLSAWKRGELAVERRAIVCDNFSDKGDDPIGGSAWRNFPPTVGAANIVEAPWDGFFPAATQGSYLWGFASGGGSYYYSMGVGTSDDFALKDLKVVFLMLMGSYFGDWNNESNFLRASLGSGHVLTATYSGFPQSLFFPTGLGASVGDAIRLTQNNLTNTVYSPWDQGQGEVHVSLLGDPTLRIYPVKPASNLSIGTAGGGASLAWSAPAGGANGYDIFRGTSAAGPFAKLNAAPVAGTSYTDLSAPPGTHVYMVRAVRLEQSPSGTFWNPSLGIFATATVSGATPQPPAAPTLQATAVSHSRIDLSWNDLANETGYRLERKIGAAGAWAEIAAPGQNATAHSDTGLSAATEHFYRLRAVNQQGASGYSAEARAVTPAAPQPQAVVRFVEQDGSTGGNWPGKFGAEGFAIAALPPSLNVTFSGKADFTWQTGSTDARAPVVAANSQQRIASAWHGSSFEAALNTGAETRRVAFYMLDWDRLGRVQRVTVRDAATGATLDAREVSSFGNGVYAVYEVKGSVRVGFEKVSGPNALCSGIFLGGQAVAPISNKPLTLGLRPAGGPLALKVSGEAGQRFRIDSSSDCRTWTPMTTGALVTNSSEMTVNPSGARLFLRAVNVP